MPLNLSIKNVPENVAAKLRARAQRNHRSLQGELMAILESAAGDVNVGRTDAGTVRYEAEAVATPASSDHLLERLLAIAGDRGLDSSKRLTREQTHDRKALRKQA
jgi:plasmid stability protein